MSRDTEVTIRATNRAIKDGLAKHFPTQPIVIEGVKWTRAQIVAALETEEAQFQAAFQQRIMWLAAVKALHDTTRVNHQLRRGLRATLLATHGRTSKVVADFGFRERAPRKPSLETVLVAVEKRRATRKARGTRGATQRKKIKGVVPIE